MSSSKAKGRTDKKSKPVVKRFSKGRLLLWGSCLVAVAAGLMWRFWFESPERLLAEARTQLPRKPAAAVKLLTRCIIAAGGSHPRAQVCLAGALALQQRWKDATEVFAVTTDTSDCDPGELFNLAQLAEQAGQFVLAEMAAAAAVRGDPNRQDALRILIRARYRLGRRMMVLEHCRQLMQLAPDDPFPWTVTGTVQEERRKLAEAITAYREALKRNPEEPSRLKNHLVQALMESGDLVAARQVMDRCLNEPPVSNRSRLRNAFLLRLEGQTAAAFDIVEEVLDKEPGSKAALMLRGVLSMDLDRHAEAADDLREIVEEDEYNRAAHYKLAQALQKSGQQQTAKRHFDTARRLNDWLLEIGRREAIAQENPDDAAVCLELARLNDQVGRKELAAQWRQAARGAQARTGHP